MLTEAPIPRIVLTGGPCGGKTTAKARVAEWLRDHRHTPVFVHEAATQVITAGFDPRNPAFQEAVLKKTLADEDQAMETILAYGIEKPVMILDRGIPDQLGYLRDRNEYRALLSRYGLTEVGAREGRYSQAIFIRSAAVGAESFYETANNNARYESLTEAQELDERTLKAWFGMTHLSIVENTPGVTFDGKMHKVVRAVARSLGIPEPLEQERKFLIEGFMLERVPPEAVSATIIQTYLFNSTGVAERVRARGSDSSWTFTHTVKQPRGAGVSIEKERPISYREYQNLLVRRDPLRREILKTRTCFAHGHHYCELDVFHREHEGLVMLEIEYDGDPSFITPPEFLGRLTDVTEDPRYSNFALAKAA